MLLTAVPDWSVAPRAGAAWVEREVHVPNVCNALDFADRLGALAGQRNHHPLPRLAGGRVLVTRRTVRIHGFHRNDFITVAKTGALCNTRD